MTILQELQNALLTAIADYQTQTANRQETISIKHQAAIEKLQGIVRESRENPAQQDAVLLRQRVGKFLTEMEVSWFTRNLPDIFGHDDLYENIKAVWYHPDFRESTLMARERAEDQIAQREAIICQKRIEARQEKILGYLEREDIKGLVNTIENLENQLEMNQKSYDNLSTKYDTLNQNYQQIHGENNILKAKNLALEQEIAELKKQKQNSEVKSKHPSYKTEQTREQEKKANPNAHFFNP